MVALLGLRAIIAQEKLATHVAPHTQSCEVLFLSILFGAYRLQRADSHHVT